MVLDRRWYSTKDVVLDIQRSIHGEALALSTPQSTDSASRSSPDAQHSQTLDVLSKCVFSFMIVNMNVYESAAPPTHKEYV